MANIGAVVETASPVPSDFGLLSPAASVVEDTSPHWVNGFSYPTLDCSTEVRLRGICSAGQAVTAVDPVGSDRFRNYVPFSVETEYECSTMGMGPEDYARLAREHLDACFQKAVEYELWTGALSKKIEANDWNAAADGPFPNRYLASTSSVDVTPTPGTAIKPAYGLALLEGALAGCGCGTKGTIHATRDVASTLAVALTRSTEDTLVTPIGNFVVAGSGYTGSGPDGTDPGGTKVWMYATGPVTVRRGEIFTTPDVLNQAVDTSVNTVNVKAEQPAAVTWDGCCVFAVLVDLSLAN